MEQTKFPMTIGANIATTEIVSDNHLLVTPKEGVVMTVLKGNSHFNSCTVEGIVISSREMFKDTLFLLTTSNFAQLVWWTGTEAIILAIVKFRADTVSVDIKYPHYFSKQKLQMLSCVKTAKHWNIAVKFLTDKFKSTLQSVTLKLQGNHRGYNSYMVFEATFRNTTNVGKMYLRAYRKFPAKSNEFFKKAQSEKFKEEVKVNFWKLNHTQLSAYGVTKKDFDYCTQDLHEVANFLMAEDTKTKVLSQKYPFFKIGNATEMRELANSCREYLANPTVNSTPKHIRVHYDTWCGNTGYGLYIHNNEFKNYHWINGAFLKTSAIANTHAIRYPISMSKEEVIAHAIKVVCRHCRRFLKEYHE